MSETTSETTRAGWAAAASRPPLMVETCLRMVFIAAIGAPEASSASLTAISSASVRPPAGDGSSAEPPPEISATTRSSSVEAGDGFEQALRGLEAGRVGHRMRGLDDLDALAGRGIAVAGDDDAFERPVPGLLEGRCHLRRALAGADDDGAALRLCRQVTADGQFGIGGGDGGLEDRGQETASGR